MGLIGKLRVYVSDRPEPFGSGPSNDLSRAVQTLLNTLGPAFRVSSVHYRPCYGPMHYLSMDVHLHHVIVRVKCRVSYVLSAQLVKKFKKEAV